MKKGLVLGFDFGTTTIGVAVGNQITRTSNSLTTVKYGGDDPAERLVDIIGKWRPSALIVGYPLGKDGSEQRMSRKAADFAETLRARYGIRTELVDERYSSAVARTEASAGEVDAKAAEIILQAWLDH